MAGRSYGAEEKAKLERLISEGSTVLREIEDLQEGLKETVKAVAEELQVNPVLLIKQLKLLIKATGANITKIGKKLKQFWILQNVSKFVII